MKEGLFWKTLVLAIICLFIGAIIVQGTCSTVSSPSANIVLSVEVGYRNDEIFSDDFDDGDISDWTVTTAGNGVFEASTDEYVSSPYSVHMKSLNEFDQAIGMSPSYSLNLSVDYEVSFYFLIPSTNNHWFEVFNNNQTYLVISSGTQLRWYNGSSSYSIMTLNTDQWYHIELKIDSSSDTYDVYIDSDYKTTSDMWIHTGFEDDFRIGDRNSDQGSYFDYGEAYWDDFNINQTYPVHNLDTGEGFLAIQSAIDDSDTLNGHTIEVSNGTYYENVIVNKTINLTGQDRNRTIIDGGGSGDVVDITADWVNISGFTIQNSGSYCGPDNDAGIEIRSNYNTITGNNASDNHDGIHLYSCNNNTITGNNINSNAYTDIFLKNSSDNILSSNNIVGPAENGIRIISSSNNNTIAGNNITSNDDFGIILRIFSNNNNITGNTITKTQNAIWLHWFCCNNTISGNIITNNTNIGVELYEFNSNNTLANNIITNNEDSGVSISYSCNNNSISNNTIMNNSNSGIFIYKSAVNPCNNNIISNNNIINNTHRGISLSSSNNTIIKGNRITNSDFGIDCNEGTSNNTISDNTIIHNRFYGAILYYSNNNTIYNNYFNNTINAWANGNNKWNITKTLGINIIGGLYLGGNYWSDYTGSDTDGDGLGDTNLPYNSSGDIQNGGDWLPLTEIGWDTTPPEISDVIVTMSDPIDTEPSYGWENVTCTVTDNAEVDEVRLNITYPDLHTENISMTDDGGGQYYYNTTFSAVGSYSYHIWTNDTSNNDNTSSVDTFQIPPNWDIYIDGKCNILDLVYVSNLYDEIGSYNGWIREDVNNDGQIKILDLVLVSNHYDETWS